MFFSDLMSGSCSSVVEVRLMRFLEVRNVRHGGELMWVDAHGGCECKLINL